LWYGVDASGAKTLSCGGEEVNLADPKGDTFDFCTASSEYPDGNWKCDMAFSGKMIDAPFHAWATDGEGVAAWMKVFF